MTRAIGILLVICAIVMMPCIAMRVNSDRPAYRDGSRVKFSPVMAVAGIGVIGVILMSLGKHNG